MKSYRIYIVAAVALIIGLLMGWLIFKGDKASSGQDVDHDGAQASEIWTCSMHPQIRQNEPGDCPICGMDLIPASQATSTNENSFQMTAEAIKLANIQTTIVGASENSDVAMLRLNGKIQINETRSASLVSHIPGRIEKLFVSYTGEQVNKGQKIAAVYSPDLITAQKELLEAQKMEDISPGLLIATKNKLKFWKISDRDIDDILNTGTLKETFNIYADHSGIVEVKKASVGDYISTGQTLFDVQDLNMLWALFDVYETDLPNIGVGNTIKFTTPSDPKRTYEAKISFVDPVIDQKTRVASIRAEVQNSGGKLKPEMFITGELSIASNSNALSVPKSAVLWTGERSVVYVKIPEMEIPSFEFREVQIGESTGSNYTVVSGLQAGEEVVTNGAFVIDASAQLNNQKSMMNRNVKSKMVHDESHLTENDINTAHENFTVYGNCGMCEKTIEGSLKNVEGIHGANWDMDSKEMHVSFDTTKISLYEIKQKIADVGYDSDTHFADDETYNDLPKCCQFERPKKIK